MRGALIAMLGGMATLVPAAVLAQTSASDFTYATRYDAARRVVGTIAPDPDGSGPLRHAAVRTTYDAAGRPVRVEKGQLLNWQSESVAPANWPDFQVSTVVETGYDAMGRKVVERASGPLPATPLTVTQWSYDGSGRPECTAVRMNPAAFGSLPASACQLGTEGSFGPDRIERQVYDAAGQVLKVQRAVGTPLQQDYATYEYTPNGRRRAVIDANGNRAEMGWDGHDRQSTWVFPSKTSVGQVDAGDYEAYGYDANGNRTSLRKRDGRTIAYTYDALNRVTAKTYPNGGARSVHYSYDLRGLQTAARFDGASGGDAVTTTYTGFGEVASSTTTMSGTSRTLTYLNDADGNRTRITHPDGTAFTSLYDGLDRMTDVAGISGYLYDAQGLVSGTYGNGYRFAHDAIGRLTSAQTIWAQAYDIDQGFAYNAAGQMVSRRQGNEAYVFPGYVSVSRSYAVNGLNQYASAGPASFTYDANGNLTGDGTNTYGYDIENRLVSASNGLQMVWDAQGRLYETSGTAHGTTRFLYDGDRLTLEYDGVGTIKRRHVHGAGADEPLAFYDGPGLGAADIRFTPGDHQGSKVLAFNGFFGLVAINSYDEYGITRNTANGSVAPYGRFGYTGQAWIPELGMYHYKARIYSPTLGRFLQTDPIGYDDQVNLYAYVGNDPVNMRDPDGMQSIYENAKRTKEAASVLIERVRSDPVGAALDVATVAAVIFDVINTPVSPGPDVSIPAAAARTALRTEARAAGRGTAAADRTAASPLRRDANGVPRPDPEAAGRPHTQLGVKEGERVGPYRQTREFDASGQPVRDRDFTDHGRSDHTNPHQHIYEPNPTGGSPRRGSAIPFD